MKSCFRNLRPWVAKKHGLGRKLSETQGVAGADCNNSCFELTLPWHDVTVYDQISKVQAFPHILQAMEVGMTWGRGYLLPSSPPKVAKQPSCTLGTWLYLAIKHTA